MDPRRPIELRVAADPSADTRIAVVGAYVVVISTALPAIGMELHSTYTGHPRGSKTTSAHLVLRPGCPPEVASVEHTAAALPVMYARAACLYDHAQRLLGLLASAGSATQVEVTDAAIAALERASADA
jgi:hypothetical protein